MAQERNVTPYLFCRSHSMSVFGHSYIFFSKKKTHKFSSLGGPEKPPNVLMCKLSVDACAPPFFTSMKFPTDS